jgi:hypothetical protein
LIIFWCVNFRRKYKPMIYTPKSSTQPGVPMPSAGASYSGVFADASMMSAARSVPALRDVYVFVPGGVLTRDGQRAAHARLHLRLTAAEATPNALRERILSSLPSIASSSNSSFDAAAQRQESPQTRWALRVVSEDATGTVALEALPTGAPIPQIVLPPLIQLPTSHRPQQQQDKAGLRGFSCVMARPAYEAAAATTQACDWVDVRIALRELHLASMRNVEETFPVPGGV